MTATILSSISPDEFFLSDPICRLIVHDHPRKFAEIHLSNASHPLTLCWRSDLVQPVVETDPVTLNVWIGVDERIVCVTSEGHTLFAMGLFFPLLQILLFDKCTVCLCDAAAYAINPDYSLRCILGLPKIPETAELKGDKLLVTFIDGESQVFAV